MPNTWPSNTWLPSPWRLALLAAILLVMALAGPANAQRRVALVIGNGAYQHTARLINPPNDAADVADALERTGFEVIRGVDLDRVGMEEAAIEFARSARNADVAMFYYAGHAMQFAGVNYLMPVDASLTDEADLRRMIRLDEILDDLRQAEGLRILVLDACRDNPLAADLSRSIGRSRSAQIGRGLARVDRPEGMIVSFATQAGSVAGDGNGRNSPYTEAFLKHIETPEEIGTVFRRVSADVYAATGQGQLPELSLSLIGEHYLAGRPEEARGAIPPGPTLVAPPPPPAASAAAWEAVKDTRDPAVLEAFLSEFPVGVYAALARSRLRELNETAVAALPPPAVVTAPPAVAADTALVPPVASVPPPSTAEPQPGVLPGPANLIPYRAQVGQVIRFALTGNGGCGPSCGVWGTDIYTDDSQLAAAAVHAGVLAPGQAGVVEVEILPGRSAYNGSQRNGVSSQTYGSWVGSFRFRGSRAAALPAASTIVEPAPGNLTDYRSRVGQVVRFTLVGDGSCGSGCSLWGSEIYTDDSSLAAAAVHAGILGPAEAGIVEVEILPGQAAYKGSARNGVESRDYGSWTGSFRFVGRSRN